MPNKNKYVSGWRTTYTEPHHPTTAPQPVTPNDKRETSTPQEPPQNPQHTSFTYAEMCDTV